MKFSLILNNPLFLAMAY